jgi:hypothetical protein
VNSQIVNKEIKKSIWPVLKAAGFSTFTARSAWRHNSNSIDVLQFHSFNKYNSEVLGVTTFSFTVGLGKYLKCIPPTWPPPVKDGVLLPPEPACDFRGSLFPTIPTSCHQKNIWFVSIDGKNLLWCVQDVRNQIPEAFQWYEDLEDRQEIFHYLKTQPTSEKLWGFGSEGSPHRLYLLGY